MDHHVLCLKFHLDYLQVQTHKDAHALAEKIVAKVENSASHQRVGLQTLNSIMNKLREYQIGDDLVDKWYAVLAETSYTGARKQARRRMTMEILQHEFKNNKNSDAGFSLAKVSPFDLSRDRSFFIFRSSRRMVKSLSPCKLFLITGDEIERNAIIHSSFGSSCALCSKRRRPSSV